MKKIKISQNEEILIKYLDEYEVDIFTYNELSNDKNLAIDSLQATLESMVKRRLLLRIEKGKYCRHNFRDEFVIGNFLAMDGVIAYWSALNLHGLTEQISNTIFVQTTKLKRDKTIFGIKYQFIKVKPEKIAGIEIAGYGNHSYKLTDREKTIIDCFDLPEYGGEFPGIVRAFVTNDWNEDKLIEYADKVNNIASIKRMGYLAELYEMPLQKFIDFACGKVTKTISLFDNASGEKGDYITSWGLRLNVSKENILAMKYY